MSRVPGREAAGDGVVSVLNDTRYAVLPGMCRYR